MHTYKIYYIIHYDSGYITFDNNIEENYVLNYLVYLAYVYDITYIMYNIYVAIVLWPVGYHARLLEAIFLRVLYLYILYIIYNVRVCGYNERVFVKWILWLLLRGNSSIFHFRPTKGERIALLKFQIWRRRLNKVLNLYRLQLLL